MGECDGDEVLIYEGDANNPDKTTKELVNPGKTTEELVAWCSKACQGLKKSTEGTTSDFTAEGFVVMPTGKYKGRCYCESNKSSECERDKDDYSLMFDRYDWRKTGPWCIGVSIIHYTCSCTRIAPELQIWSKLNISPMAHATMEKGL